MELPKLNPKKEAEKIIKFIRETLKREGFKKLVLGLSGGVDSSTCAFLATKAIGPKNLSVLLLPYKNQDVSLAKKVIKKLKNPAKNVIEVNITQSVKTILSIINKSISKNTKYKILNTKYYILTGNLIARVRMIITFDMAKRLNALVCGTENRSEYLLGYFTRFGDEASDIEPLRHLYKTQVYQLAKYLGVPQEIIKTTPTAGLWPGQTDEKELGFTYEEADIVLHLLLDKKMKVEEIKKFDIEKLRDKKLVSKILKRIKENLFKHQVPYHIYL